MPILAILGSIGDVTGGDPWSEGTLHYKSNTKTVGPGSKASCS